MTFNCGSQICRSLAALPIMGALLCRWRDFINSWYYLCYVYTFFVLSLGLMRAFQVMCVCYCSLVLWTAVGCVTVNSIFPILWWMTIRLVLPFIVIFVRFCFVFCFVFCFIFIFFHAFYILSHKRRLTGWRGGEWKWVPVLWRRWL